VTLQLAQTVSSADTCSGTLLQQCGVTFQYRLCSIAC